MRAAGLLATLVLAAVPVTGIAQSPAFDVVSIKRASDLTTRAMRPVVGEVRPGGIWIATDATLVGLVRGCSTAGNCGQTPSLGRR